jgi:hypothetical protein
LLALSVRQRSAIGWRERFWIGFVPFCAVLGVLVHPMRNLNIDIWGIAHICGLPLLLLGVAFLATRLSILSRPWQWLVLAGCAVDFFLGIYLHFRLENQIYRYVVGRSGIELLPAADYLSLTAYNGWTLKMKHQLHFLGDYAAPWARWLELAVCIAFGVAWMLLAIGLTSRYGKRIRPV